MLITTFNKGISLKSVGCTHGSATPKPVSPSVNLFVRVTNTCNARCGFCSNAHHAGNKVNFNNDKLWEIVDALIENGIRINRINITGGEPATVPSLVDTILLNASDSKYLAIHCHLNTNGLLSTSQEMMKHGRWDSISVSLHHYNLKTLSEIYGVNIQESALSFEGIDLDKVNASCNLIKGYVDSTSEVENMLKFSISLGLPRLGFVSLMKINDFSRKFYIDFDEINFEKIPHLYFTESRNRGKDCKCSNYLYNFDGRILEVYMRNYANPQYCESSLLYDGQFLRQGFHDDNIIY